MINNNHNDLPSEEKMSISFIVSNVFLVSQVLIWGKREIYLKSMVCLIIHKENVKLY